MKYVILYLHIVRYKSRGGDDILSILNIYIISDSLGETGALVAKAAISQFKTENYKIKRFPYVYEIDKLKEILDEAASVDNSIVVYTLVDEVLVGYIKEYELKTGLSTLDLMTPFLDAFSEKNWN